MSDLANQQCQPYPEGSTPLTEDEAKKYLEELHNNWSLSDNTKSIIRDFKFNNYYKTIAFVNTVAEIAHQQDHHPEMTISYNLCHVEYSTHSVDGLSENDFICAAKIDSAFNR